MNKLNQMLLLSIFSFGFGTNIAHSEVNQAMVGIWNLKEKNHSLGCVTEPYVRLPNGEGLLKYFDYNENPILFYYVTSWQETCTSQGNIETCTGSDPRDKSTQTTIRYKINIENKDKINSCEIDINGTIKTDTCFTMKRCDTSLFKIDFEKALLDKSKPSTQIFP